jgi:hypothetical protein
MPRSRGKFLPGESGNPETQFKPGNPNRFPRGVSGNPAGKPRSRVQFEQALVDAITNRGTPEEAADLLWEAARAGEAWAIQNLLVRFWPTSQTLKIETPNANQYDFSRLSTEQLRELERLLEAAAAQPQQLESGTGAPELP